MSDPTTLGGAHLWSDLLANEYGPEIWQGTLDTLTMTGLSLLFTVLIGLPLGVALFLTGWSQRSQRRAVARIQWSYAGTDRCYIALSDRAKRTGALPAAQLPHIGRP